MRSNRKHRISPQAGFSLVEIMVGLAIGMLATVVIVQAMSVFEVQKRTTTGTADAQTNGNIALFQIQRELAMAGYTLMPFGNAGTADSALECTSLTINGTVDTTIPNRLSPVTIADGAGEAGSDTITIRYGTSPAGGVVTVLTADAVASDTLPAPAMKLAVKGSLGCRRNETALVMKGANCAMTRVADDPNAVPDATTINLADNTAVTAGAAVNSGLIACLGNWNEVTYSVAGGNLVRAGTPGVAGIVNVQAQYGIADSGVASDQNNFNRITSWVNATGTWATPSVADRNRIKAVRVAVVARNGKREAAEVTTALSAWTAPDVNSPAPAINLQSSDSDWKHYRYRVFETIIPLRNVIWAKGTL